METVSASLEKAGHISKAERESVSNISGHSGQVAKEFYVLENRLEDVDNARNIANICSGLPR